ncbi:hypothetical protein KIN20_001848 [Parelaphostrongylus tenuis]|uniref:G protein-coupled receptor n=1 Tax=Parelaphostrongylus tenuis TaxID=148309 RepID=A0AAD5LUC4_PARTN|nr:hypothetical protein KIN20_001848 [Parelaphostrongylus tenuis]
MICVPPGAVKTFNQLAMLTIAISFVCMVKFHALTQLNKKQCTINTATLTTRYQTRENVVTTQFVTSIAIVHVAIIVMYATSGISFQLFGPVLFRYNKKLYPAARKICVIPLTNLLVTSLKHYRINRDANIRSIVMMESRGRVGTRNYEETIGKAWQLNGP